MIGDWVRRVLLASAVLQVCVGFGATARSPAGPLAHGAGRPGCSASRDLPRLRASLGGLITRLPNFVFRFAQQGEVLSRIDALLAEPPLSRALSSERPMIGLSASKGSASVAAERMVLDQIDLVLEPGTVTASSAPAGRARPPWPTF